MLIVMVDFRISFYWISLNLEFFFLRIKLESINLNFNISVGGKIFGKAIGGIKLIRLVKNRLWGYQISDPASNYLKSRGKILKNRGNEVMNINWSIVGQIDDSYPNLVTLCGY